MIIQKNLREMCAILRRAPLPLVTVIPTMQDAADRIDELEAALRQARDALLFVNSAVDGYYIQRGESQLPEITKAVAAIDAALEKP